MDEIVWWKTILYIKLGKLWNKAASKQIKIMIMGSFKRAASVSSRMLRDSKPHYVGPLVGRSVSRSVGRSVGWLVGWSPFGQRPQRGR